jgi:HlyD family secretion protein
MTTNITFAIEQRENVLAIPNAALRFRPELSEEEQRELREQMEARRAQRESQQSATDSRQGPQQSERQGRRDRAENGESQDNTRSDGGRRRQGQMVWVLVDGKKIEPRFVRTGLTNGRVTEIVAGNLEEGDTVIIGKTETENRAGSQPAASPFGPQPGARGFGGGRRR